MPQTTFKGFSQQQQKKNLKRIRKMRVIKVEFFITVYLIYDS